MTCRHEAKQTNKKNKQNTNKTQTKTSAPWKKEAQYIAYGNIREAKGEDKNAKWSHHIACCKKITSKYKKQTHHMAYAHANSNCEKALHGGDRKGNIT